MFINNHDYNCIIYFDPLAPACDKHLISPYNISSESNIKVMRIKELITNS